MSATLAAALASLALLVVVFVPLERVFPARPGQPVARPALAVDLCFFFGQYLLWNGVSLSLVALVRGGLDLHVPSGLRAAFAGQPLWAQAVEALVLGDLVVYWFHRACHTFDWLWRFHAVHHTSEHLDWLAAHREHPLDGIGTQLSANLPALVLGFEPRAVAGLVVLRGMWAIFVHSNVRLPLGPLRWILGAPELHRWHHARVDRTRHNFANVAPWLDVVFGTHHLPEGEETYPLGVDEPGPRDYAGQLLRPFLPRGRSTVEQAPLPGETAIR
jgi:sterol desaturase/sphingolipid hydroxylase (fatty acid hydroxylase superfamily)